LVEIMGYGVAVQILASRRWVVPTPVCSAPRITELGVHGWCQAGVAGCAQRARDLLRMRDTLAHREPDGTDR
jgi:hypothetical protein